MASANRITREKPDRDNSRYTLGSEQHRLLAAFVYVRRKNLLKSGDFVFLVLGLEDEDKRQ